MESQWDPRSGARGASIAGARGGWPRQIAEPRNPGLSNREDGRKRGVRGYDAGKKTKGRKRQVVVDTLGLIHALIVEAGDIQDRTGGKTVLSLLADSPRLKLVLADAAYRGEPMVEHAGELGFQIEFISSLKGSGFTPQARRWVVERTFAWLLKCRRLRVDYDTLCETTKAWIYLAMIRIMTRRLALTRMQAAKAAEESTVRG